jgi:WD40 repeat protein
LRNGLSVDPGSGLIAFATANTILISDTEKGLFTLNLHEKRVNFVKWISLPSTSPHSKAICSVGDDSKIIFWTCEGNPALFTSWRATEFPNHSESELPSQVHYLCSTFFNDELYLLTYNMDGVLKLWHYGETLAEVGRLSFGQLLQEAILMCQI